MNILPLLSFLATLVGKAVHGLIDPTLQRSLLSYIHAFRRPKYSYENLLLAINLELCDVKGRKAILRRTQRVRFLAEGAGIVRDVFWGDGKALTDYVVEGAERLSVRHEGSKSVVLLGLHTNPAKGEIVKMRTERTIRGGFKLDQGYLETLVERDTKRVRLTVLFPRERPPRHVQVDASPPVIESHPLSLHLTGTGTGRATWGTANPKHLVTYRIRWDW